MSPQPVTIWKGAPGRARLSGLSSVSGYVTVPSVPDVAAAAHRPPPPVARATADATLAATPVMTGRGWPVPVLHRFDRRAVRRRSGDILRGKSVVCSSRRRVNIAKLTENAGFRGGCDQAGRGACTRQSDETEQKIASVHFRNSSIIPFPAGGRSRFGKQDCGSPTAVRLMRKCGRDGIVSTFRVDAREGSFQVPTPGDRRRVAKHIRGRMGI